MVLHDHCLSRFIISVLYQKWTDLVVLHDHCLSRFIISVLYQKWTDVFVLHDHCPSRLIISVLHPNRTDVVDCAYIYSPCVVCSWQIGDILIDIDTVHINNLTGITTINVFGEFITVYGDTTTQYRFCQLVAVAAVLFSVMPCGGV